MGEWEKGRQSEGGGVERGWRTLISIMLGSAEHEHDSAMAGLVHITALSL